VAEWHRSQNLRIENDGVVILFSRRLTAGFRMLGSIQMASELRQAIRTLLRNPGFAISAIVILGLACAATTTIFSLAYGILLRDLPYGQPDRLVTIGTRPPAAGFPKAYAGAADYFDWRKRQQVFEDI